MGGLACLLAGLYWRSGNDTKKIGCFCLFGLEERIFVAGGLMVWLEWREHIRHMIQGVDFGVINANFEGLE